MKNYCNFTEQTGSVLEALDCYWGFFGERNIDEENNELTFYPNGFFHLINPETSMLQIYDNRCQLIASNALDFHVFENGYYALSVEKKESYQFYDPHGNLIAGYDNVVFFGAYNHFVLKKNDTFFILTVDDLSQSHAIGSIDNIVKFWDADDGKIAVYQNYEVILYDKDFCKIHLIPNIICVDFFSGGNFIVWTAKKGVLYDPTYIPLLDNLDVDYRWLVQNKMCRNMDATYDCLTAQPIEHNQYLIGVPKCKIHVSDKDDVSLHFNEDHLSLQKDDKVFGIAEKFIGIIRNHHIVILAIDVPLQQQKMLFDAFIRKTSGNDISDTLFEYGQIFASLVLGDKLNKREILHYLLSH